MTDIALHITGMNCNHCLNAVTSALANVGGVETISVRMGRADLRIHDTGLVEAAKTAVEDAGYRVEGVTGL